MVSDRELMCLFCDGDDAAFTTIVQRYEWLLLAFARRFFRDHEKAQDLCQMVWLQLFLSRPLVTEQQVSLKPWLITVLQHRCIDERNREKRRALLFSNLNEEENAFVDLLKDEDDLPEDAFEAQQEQQLVAWAIDQLPPKYRTFLWLQTYQQLSYVQIAQILSCRPDTVKTHLHRARLRVRQILIQRADSMYDIS